MKKVFSLFFIFCTIYTYAQRQKVQDYIDAYKDIAMDEMRRSGVPASITLAQGILESASGQSDLCVQSNNHFGIKCKDEWTGEKVYHDDDQKAECFRKYPTAAESFKDHSDFLRTRHHYDFLFTLDPTDFEGWAKGLKKAGYATEKDYPERLLSVINTYNLNQYTLYVLQNNAPSSDLASTSPNSSVMTKDQQSSPTFIDLNTGKETKDTETLTELVIPITSKRLKALQDSTQSNIAETTAQTQANTTIDQSPDQLPYNYPPGIFTINGRKVIFAQANTSSLAIAMQYELSLSDLFQYNDMQPMEILPKPQLMFLEKKAKRGAKDYHVVKEGEDTYTISQCEGIILENLLQYNNLQRESLPSAGSKLLLKQTSSGISSRLLGFTNN